ncbi:uncharacterized protein LOC121232718 [Aquila chrysaetos chrysaetos]|uniref:uncharacterized protein LOC121232718 n=1 Tax=Aquila chrysaetos chrysaetos TaxID=223781 RepID=UPI001B7D2CD3|nr:uncharacterized protein LOC121232718 [Aquila chrysaetos chrysaetos]
MRGCLSAGARCGAGAVLGKHLGEIGALQKRRPGESPNEGRVGGEAGALAGRAEVWGRWGSIEPEREPVVVLGVPALRAGLRRNGRVPRVLVGEGGRNAAAAPRAQCRPALGAQSAERQRRHRTGAQQRRRLRCCRLVAKVRYGSPAFARRLWPLRRAVGGRRMRGLREQRVGAQGAGLGGSGRAPGLRVDVSCHHFTVVALSSAVKVQDRWKDSVVVCKYKLYSPNK